MCWLKLQGQGFEKLSIASHKYTILRKVHFCLKRGFQVITFFYSFGGEIPCYNCRKIS